MNRGTAYANAKGFSMGSMAQLINIKSAIDRSTLLEVLVENLTTCHPTPPAGLDDDGDVAGEQAEATNVRARGDAAGGQGGAAKVQGDSDEQPDDAAGKRADDAADELIIADDAADELADGYEAPSLVAQLCEDLQLLRSASRENLPALNEAYAEIRAGAIRVR